MNLMYLTNIEAELQATFTEMELAILKRICVSRNNSRSPQEES